MAGTSSALNLSLLSRGIGEVSKNGHEKIDVVFEPQDYFNFAGGSRGIYLPPISPHYSFEGPKNSPVPRYKSEVPIPKTFTTRKGALLLYSEDMAQKRWHPHTIRRHRRPVHFLDDASSTSSQSDDENDLRTVDDLAKSILSYGSQQEQTDSNGVYLKFLHGRRKRDYFERQIRPGFSAKRYLSSWTKSWDDSVLEKVISKGYLTEKSLFYYNPLMPHLQRRLNDDMSHFPTPYRLMRSMLMSPGSLSGYTFYRVRPESAETILTQDLEMQVPPGSRGASIKVISTKDGVQREVTYASLDKRAQEEVLTDLLVKSAVHYAIKKQQEYFEDSLARVIESGREIPIRKEEITPVPRFDMKDAVETLLDAQKGTRVLETDFPDDRSQHSGSFKGKAIYRKRKSGASKEKGSLSVSPASDDREYVGNVPVVSFRASEPEHMANVPSLPRIPGVLPLPPIGEASREGTRTQGFVVTLPSIGKEGPLVNVEPPTPQHTVLSAGGAREPGLTAQLETPEEYEGWATDEETKSDAEKRKRRRKLKTKNLEGGPVVSGGAWLQSSSESLGAASMHSMPERKPVRVQWKGSTQSIKSKGSKGGAVSARSNQSSTAGSGMEESSVRGSVIIGPGGEMMNVGGAIVPLPRQDVSAVVIDHVHDANKDKEMASEESENDEPDEWRQNRRPRHTEKYANRRESVKSELSEEEIVGALTEHAQKIATSVLSQDDSGADLEADVRSVIDEVIKSQKMKSAGPTAGEYRELIRESLKTAIVMSGEDLPADTEVSPELMETLKSKSVSPEDIEVVQDEDTGKALIRTKSQMKIAMGGVKEGHIFVAGDKNGVKNPSIPADRASNIDVGEIEVINYGLADSDAKTESDRMSEKAPSEKAYSIKSASGKISTMSASSVKVASEKAPSEKALSEKAPSEKAESKKGKSQPASVIGESIIEEPEVTEGKPSEEIEPDVDEFKKAVEEMEKQKEPPASPVKSESRSVKSGKSGKSEDKKSRVSVKSEKSLEKSKTSDKKEEFVVGNVDYKGELEKLFGKVPEPKGKPKEKKAAPPKKVQKKAKKGAAVKGKKKEELAVEAPPPPKEPTPPPPKEPTPPPPKEPTPPPPKDQDSDRESVAESKTTEEDDYEFTIVRDSPSPSPPPPQAPSTIASAEDDDYDEKEDEDIEEDDEAARLRMISNREARAAKRAAQAEKRKQEVEQRRKEREEQLRREKEQQEKQMQFKLQMEEERRRREEERRLKKQAEEDERIRQEKEEQERLNRQKLEQDKERRRREEYQRKLEEMKRKQIEEEQRKRDEMIRRQQEEEERKKLEQEMLAKMEEEERLEYERKKKEEEEERKRKEEEERLRREEEARLAMEEARRLAEEMARKQAEMEARLKFNRALQLEAGGMNHSQGMTRAFVFSYYELLQWLGLDIPEFELLKLTQY